MARVSALLFMEETQNNRDRPQAHQIRITSHGKIRAWVEFALNHLKNSPEIPLSLHTLPSDNNESAEAAKPSKNEKGRGLSTSTTTIPRLLSVVEIIKREYLAALEINQSTSLRGLHQYNEIGCFEHEESTARDDRTQALAMALEGKNHPKEKKNPYMRITLSVNVLEIEGATYQPPLMRQLSKSAKARARKRRKLETEAE